MRRPMIALGVLFLVTGWREREPQWPHAGPMPDEPVPVPSSHYEPVGAGTRSYRPVEPMPWGDVNRRVAPPGEPPQSGPTKPDAQSTPAPTEGAPSGPAGHQGH